MDVDLAPDTTLGASVLAGVPLAFALHCPAGASAGCGREGTLIPVLSIRRWSGPWDPR
jgi:protein tyrosine phosphatase